MGKGSAKRLVASDAGNLSITTAVVGMMLMTAVGATLDGGRMITTKQQLQSISDSAALMAAMPERLSDRQRIALANRSIEDQLSRRERLSVDAPKIDIGDGGSRITVGLSSEVPLLFGAFMGGSKRRISVSSTAEESFSASLKATSISIVLDLSSSMDGRLDTGSKLASVQAAMSEVLGAIEADFGGEAVAETRLSTGLYPFNWGMVDGETVALTPGTDRVVDALSYIALSDGSVPTTAMEKAVEDQLDGPGGADRNRYIVYITDGKVDEDKSDVAGRHLREHEMFDVRDTDECRRVAESLLELDLVLDPDLADVPDNRSVLGNVLDPLLNPPRGRRGDDDDDNDDDDDDDDDDRKKRPKADKKHAGHDHGSEKARRKAVRLDMREDFIQECRPTQPIRVAEACRKAREDGISIIAVNLSGEDGIASNMVDMCIDGIDDVNGTDKGKPRKREKRQAHQTAPATRTLPSGMTVRISADGTSQAADVTSLSELRALLSSVLPEAGRTSRTVRLVG